MNKTKIEWCDMTWNPVTGCYHDCHYCYATKIANRFKSEYADSWESLANMQQSDYPTVMAEKDCCPYPHGFIPTFYSGRLDEPAQVKKPQNIFVCSMADLFGEWVPKEWIQTVFNACEKAPQHRYLFLTKNPERYLEFLEIEEDNYWLGITITTQKDMEKLNVFYRGNNHYENMFLNIEPIQECILLNNDFIPDWAIIGAETGNRKGKVIPKREWIENIVNYCREKNVPVFMKDSLAEIWQEPLIREFPRMDKWDELEL